MCTVTVTPRADSGARHAKIVPTSLRLACNRDELRSRPLADPPEIREFGGRRAIFPIDRPSGGTWIAVSDAGMIFALLNVNPEAPPPRPAAPRSRGEIIPGLLSAETLPDAASRLQGLNVGAYVPFRLVFCNESGLIEARANGARLALIEHGPVDRPMLFTSSGLGDALVESPRRALFDDMVAASDDWPAAQDRFHRHRWPDRPHLSVNMSRDAAHTVSLTVVELRAGAVALTYSAGAPDQPVSPVTLRLARG